MSKRNLATIDTDIGQEWSRIIQDAFADGIDCDLITEGGLETTGSAQAIMSVSATKNYAIGTRRAHDGKVFRYAKSATGAALVAGNVIQSASLGGGSTSSEYDMTIATASTAGSNFAYATLKSTGATAALVNAYKDGYYIVSDGSAVQGVGQMKKILSHPAATGQVSIKFTFTNTLEVGVSTSSAAGLVKNLYDDVIQAPVTSGTGVTAGVAPVAVPVATPYFWLQTWGLCPMLINDALTAGTMVVRDISAAGAGSIGSTGATALAAEKIGRTGWVTDTTDNGFVYLIVAP